MKALVKCANNLAIQKLYSLANWIIHGVYDFVCGAVCQSAPLGYLGSKVPKKIKRRVDLSMSEEQRLSISRSIVAESEQLLSLVRTAALSHEEITNHCGRLGFQKRKLRISDAVKRSWNSLQFWHWP